MKNRVPDANKQFTQPRKFMAKSYTNLSMKSMGNTPSTPGSSMSRNNLIRKGSIISANDLDVIDEEEKSVEMEEMTLDRSKIKQRMENNIKNKLLSSYAAEIKDF